jgi:hypothetical protein
VISGPAVVEEGSIVEDVFVIHGGARIHGRETGDVVVLSGRVEISGEVDGDVTAAAGQIELVDGAVVGGDVLYGNDDREPQIGPQATVGGTVSHEGWDRAFDALPVLGGAALWLAMTISTLVLGLILVLVFPRAADAIGAQARERLLFVVGVGAATFVAVPIAAGLAAVTLVGNSARPGAALRPAAAGGARLRHVRLDPGPQTHREPRGTRCPPSSPASGSCGRSRSCRCSAGSSG